MCFIHTRFSDSKVSVRSSIGVRFNNLRSNRLSTTKRYVGSLSTVFQASIQLFLDMQYSNYQMKSTPKNDLLRMDNTVQNLSITPRYTFESFGGNSNLSVTYSLQDFSDGNIAASSNNASTTQSVFTIWGIGFPSTLNVNTSMSYTSTKASLAATSIKTIGETIRHQLLDNRLTASVSLTYRINSVSASDGQFIHRYTATYDGKKWGRISLNVMSSNHRYGDSVHNSDFDEFLTTLIYAVSF